VDFAQIVLISTARIRVLPKSDEPEGGGDHSLIVEVD
jgi:hypothetical protein